MLVTWCSSTCLFFEKTPSIPLKVTLISNLPLKMCFHQWYQVSTFIPFAPLSLGSAGSHYHYVMGACQFFSQNASYTPLSHLISFFSLLHFCSMTKLARMSCCKVMLQLLNLAHVFFLLHCTPLSSLSSSDGDHWMALIGASWREQGLRGSAQGPHLPTRLVRQPRHTGACCRYRYCRRKAPSLHAPPLHSYHTQRLF